MLNLMRECAPWLTLKRAIVIGGALLGIALISGLEGRLVALLGATPLIALLVCLIPCAIPLLLLRRSAKNGAAPAAQCGCDTCGEASGVRD